MFLYNNASIGQTNGVKIKKARFACFDHVMRDSPIIEMREESLVDQSTYNIVQLELLENR